MANDLVCVDLSHHNGDPDFAKAKSNGLLGCIHKATEGTSFVDKKYAGRRAAAEAVGIAWSSYHFLKHGNVENQMRFYLATVDPLVGERVCIDYEDAACTLDDLRAAIRAIQSARPDLQIAVYAGHLIKEQLGSARDDLLAQTSLWIAHYTTATAPKWPTGTWPVWTLWQYSDGSAGGSPRDVPGIASPHDCNAFNGSRENFLKWMGPAGSVAPPVPQPDADLVTINITTTRKCDIAVIVNGEVWDVSTR